MDLVEDLRQRSSVPHCMPSKDEGSTKVACDGQEIPAVGAVEAPPGQEWGAVGMESRLPPSAEFPAGF